jgi:hypothetical protein
LIRERVTDFFGRPAGLPEVLGADSGGVLDAHVWGLSPVAKRVQGCSRDAEALRDLTDGQEGMRRRRERA